MKKTIFPNISLSERVKSLAEKYNTADFIKNDPIQFPHRYSKKQDIEISAFVTSWISWGKRELIIRIANHIDTDLFCGSPLEYVMSQKWEIFKNSTKCLYRTVKYSDFYDIMQCLYNIYVSYPDMETAISKKMDKGETLIKALYSYFEGVSGVANPDKGSPCKRLWFFLRWMIRRDKFVDFGIWQSISPTELIIPLDVHVFQEAKKMGITSRNSADAKTAEEITAFFREIFPNDPVKGDFALFGLGVNQ